MSNPLYNMMGNKVPQLPGALGNMQNFMQRFNQFKQTFQGDPRQKVQEMLNSGQITQAQYNQAVQITEAIKSMLPK